METEAVDTRRRPRPRGWEDVMARAKRLHRPRLRDWGAEGFATRRAAQFAALERLSEDAEGVDVVDIGDVDVGSFRARFEEPGRPAVLRGVPEAEAWKAADWSLDDLLALFPDRTFKVGEDDEGYPVRVALRHFASYQQANRDDSPLYVFDSRFGRGGLQPEQRVLGGGNPLLAAYGVPSIFRDDLMAYAGDKRRPPHRWFLVGPRRSGSCVHVDPLGTAAWNTSLRGRKRWVLFPPGTPKHIVKGKSVIRQGEDDEACNYFVDHLPRMRRRYQGRGVRFVEFIQREGDTVFVPEGWWHAVLNLDDTIAVTQNFVSPVNLPSAWRRCRVERKMMAKKWLHELDQHRPELAIELRALNRADRFEMEEYLEYKDRRRQEKAAAKAAKAQKSIMAPETGALRKDSERASDLTGLRDPEDPRDPCIPAAASEKMQP